MEGGGTPSMATEVSSTVCVRLTRIVEWEHTGLPWRCFHSHQVNCSIEQTIQVRESKRMQTKTLLAKYSQNQNVLQIVVTLILTHVNTII